MPPLADLGLIDMKLEVDKGFVFFFGFGVHAAGSVLFRAVQVHNVLTPWISPHNAAGV